MERFLADNPNRAYLPRLARLASGGSNPVGVEVGVADGRFSELALLDMLPHQWFMIEPFPNARLKARLDRNCTADKRHTSCSHGVQPWSSRGVGHRTKLTFLRVLPASPDARRAARPPLGVAGTSAATRSPARSRRSSACSRR